MVTHPSLQHILGYSTSADQIFGQVHAKWKHFWNMSHLRHPTLEPNHNVFLSLSGKQKDFTEQLYWELKRCQYHLLFNKDQDSLPVEKKFPEGIFNAAWQCQVAVFILSEDFFTNSKWPMLELAAFVESQKESQKNLFLSLST